LKQNSASIHNAASEVTKQILNYWMTVKEPGTMKEVPRTELWLHSARDIVTVKYLAEALHERIESWFDRNSHFYDRTE